MLLDLTPAMTEVILFIGCLALLLVGAFRERDAAQILPGLAALVMFVAALVAVAHDKTRVLTFGGHFVLDGYAVFLKVLILLGAGGALLMAGAFMRDERIDRYEYALLALFSTLGMCMMVSANSFLALYMALELQSLALYVLAAFHRDNLRSTEAGLKYFILGALASGMLLYGCSLVYGFTGTIQFDALAQLWQAGTGAALPLGALVGLVFIVAGLAFKMSAVPFHMWTPDVYEGSPSPVTAFMSAAPKVAAVGLAVRVLFGPFGTWVDQWQQIVIAISIASMALGAFAAIGQTNIKRLMAYSGIANVGFALVGVAAGTSAGVNGTLVYMAIYMVMTLGTFACILMMRRQGRYIETIADLAGLSRGRPMMALALAVLMFSLAGIPPLAGFIGKLYVFKAAIDAGLLWFAVVGLLLSVVGAYYYLRIVKLMYFDEPAEPFDASPSMRVSVVAGVCAALLLFFMLPFVASPLLSTAATATAALTR
ncbi:MAG: NADH-quinone oxidoreductase subunit NuoN [Geminicoccaceae bacterium]